MYSICTRSSNLPAINSPTAHHHPPHLAVPPSIVLMNPFPKFITNVQPRNMQKKAKKAKWFCSCVLIISRLLSCDKTCDINRQGPYMNASCSITRCKMQLSLPMFDLNLSPSGPCALSAISSYYTGLSLLAQTTDRAQWCYRFALHPQRCLCCLHKWSRCVKLKNSCLL